MFRFGLLIQFFYHLGRTIILEHLLSSGRSLKLFILNIDLLNQQVHLLFKLGVLFFLTIDLF